jgi:hypothetical protein
VQFEARLRQGIADGTITVAFRRWQRPQVVAGRRYRTGLGLADCVAIERVTLSAITVADARRAGYATRRAAVDDLAARGNAPVYRVEFRAADAVDPRAALAATALLSADDVAAIDARLDRFDAGGSFGPWTAATLDAIAREPGRRAPDLAARFGRETAPFKRDVRKLKELGLTLSLEVGYRLSPRGDAYLRSTSRAARTTASP